MGGLSAICEFCNAFHWIEEVASGTTLFEVCCKKGDITLDRLLSPPPYLKSLLEEQGPEGRDFRRQIRGYNNALAFTSVSYNKDTRTNLSVGIQSFCIHGELFHYQGSVVPEPGETPAFAQLFFYDPDYATNVRCARNTRLNRSLLLQLTTMLTDINPFIRIYKTARERLANQSQNLRILLNPQIRLVVESGADRRRENLPTSDEVAVIIPDETAEQSCRDILLAVRNPGRNSPALTRVNVTHAAYMPLHYVLLFPHGDLGWHYGLTIHGNHRTVQRLQQREFYRFRLHVRNGEYPTLFYAQRLFQQYIVDAFASCESTTLDWLRRHQDKIRADVYSGLADTLIRQDADPAQLGRRFVLPSSFVGSDRFMQQMFQDSMAIVRHFGKPDLFITFTANPRWPEIVNNLYTGQQATDRPDLIARVFRLKVKALLAELKNNLFGPYAGHVYTIEYQKRGLPHMHLLLFLKTCARFLTPERIDEVVCARLPDPEWDPTGELTEIVLSNMTHGPCGLDNLNAPCMASRFTNMPPTCQKRFPKPFSELTVVHEDSYPQYRRPDDGRTFTVPKPAFPNETIVRDNSWVVPYNPYLLKRYQAHINVEVCATVQAIKYIHKYVYKGTDRTTMQVQNADDEILRYVQGRYVGPPEAYWRIMEFSTHQEWPPVQHLALHLEGQHTVYFADELTPEALAEKMEQSRSTLMAFFKYNTEHPNGPLRLYSEFPQHFTWQPRTHTWQIRKKGFAIGRIYHCSPVAGEKFYLRLLLTSVPGARSFADLYMVDGVRYPTYQAACIARGLAEDDQEWYRCFDEAVLFSSAGSLRTLFLTGLRQQLMADPLIIWDRYKQYFADDLYRRLSTRAVDFPLPLQDPHYDYALFLLAAGLADQQRSLTGVGLPENVWDWSVAHEQSYHVDRIAIYGTLTDEMKAQLNNDQLLAFDTIVTAIRDDPQTAHFYLQGPGGTGKTFLYKTLCYYFRSQEKIVLCVASTGIAALLLPDGCTSHSQFKIPINLHETSTSSITKECLLARLLLRVDLIIWDEVPMQHKFCFEVVHRLLVDVRSTEDDILFGGVPVILGGDFAQILPVVPQGTRADVIQASLQRTFVWQKLRRLALRKNMRVNNGPYSEDFVSWIGNLSYLPELYNQPIRLPEYITQPPFVLDLINQIYPIDLLLRSVTDHTIFHKRAILSTLNRTVTELNTILLDRFPGELRTYSSIDSADVNEAGDNEVHEIPAEHLQSIDIASLPPSRLHLKVGVPIMLLRNLCPKEGLCNGSRLVVTSLRPHCIEARLLGGDFNGQLRVIPRIKLSSAESQLSFILTRKQFPVRLCFAMTINKSQGQSFDIVGVDLRSMVFSHGQFYVAMSRVSNPAGLFVLLPPESRTTYNIVWPEILENLTYKWDTE